MSVRIVAFSLFFMLGTLLAHPIKSVRAEGDAETADAERGTYSPLGDANYPTNLYWGDTHLHTNMSVDANGMGNRALSPEDAYRFAKGETIRAHNGQPVRLRHKLDFLVISDHAVNLGVLPRLQEMDPLILGTEVGKRWLVELEKQHLQTGKVLKMTSRERYGTSMAKIGNKAFFWRSWATDYVADKAFRRSVWQEVCANAERHNDPGNFTAFIGFEWTPPARHPKSPNFHRNIIFEGGAEQASQVLPFSTQDSNNVEDLWAYLKVYEELTGGKVLAIPHNGNLSSGMMFAPVKFDGKPFDEAYARSRARWEPLFEVTQYKGDSEVHPIISPNDEFADFERWHFHRSYRNKPEGWEKQKQYEYARSALKLGLGHQAKFGINPFKFGMIGSTDAHTSLSTAREDNFWGKISLYEPSPLRALTSAHFACSGMAAVWATENTRRSIFAAMKRRETYATTGPRMRVRFFGGWDFVERDAWRNDVVKIGYGKGVPMGGDLTHAPDGKSPTFLVRAVKDPDGANLDRVQIIKGWRDAQGELHERIYNVALSDGRRASADGTIPPVGNTVNVEEATYINSIGDAELAVTWRDPDFDPKHLAFYYVRLIEIPTPRWTAYDAKYFGTELPADTPMITRERAYTSPIWYTPR